MNKSEAYQWAIKRIRAQVLRHIDINATLGNTAAILKHCFPNFLWVGFYLVRSDHLLLGPFQGPPACVKLGLDRGVCAASVLRNETVLVPDVHQFPGHVACDDRANSEIAVPVRTAGGSVVAVLDVDSGQPHDFDDEDVRGLQSIAFMLKDLFRVTDG